MHHQKPASGEGIRASANSERPACCCLVYRQADERDRAVAGYLSDGLDRNEKVVVIMAGPWQKGLRRGLAEQGLNLVDAERRGRATMVSPEAAGLVTASTPATAVECLAALERKAKAGQFQGVRVYWEMSGAMVEKDLAWLREVIAGCVHLTCRAGIALLAGYDRQQVASGLLVEMLRLYPEVMHQEQGAPNRCYRAAEAPLSAVRAAREFFGEAGRQKEKRGKRPYRRGQVLDALFAAAPIGIWLLDQEQRMVFTNRNFCTATGVSEEEFLQAEHYSQVMRPEETIECMLSDLRAYQADGPVEVEELISDAAGRPHVFQVVKTKVVNDEQQVEGLLGLAIDVTERKEVESRLRHSEKRFRDIALSMADFIWEIDAGGRFSYCSDQVEEMLGYAAQDLCGRSCFDLFSSKEALRLEKLFCNPDTPRKPFRGLQSWAFDKDGNKRFLRISGVPISSEQGCFQGYRGVTEDVTGRKQAEAGMQRALAEAELARDQVDSIIKSTADGLIVTDPRYHTILLINDSARDLLHSGPRDLVGQPVAAVLKDAGLLRQVEAIYQDDAPPLLQADLCLIETASTEKQVLQARTSLMRNKQGRVSGAITMLRDVTQERELDRLKAEFMSMAAHELRTPLTAILGYAELCMNPEEFGGFSDAQQREFIAEINSKAEVLAKLVNDLLDISRLEMGKPLPLNIERIAIGPILARVVERYRLLAPKHAFAIEVMDSLPEQVLADTGKLEQVLENLFSNAVKYSPEGSLIRVFSEKAGDYCQVTVADSGIGMNPQQVERVFDKFYRADFSNTAAKGIGLGMSIARQIVEQHGGSIRVESNPGTGTRAIFTVPLGE
jgi:PAS domain S-box-containing protein